MRMTSLFGRTLREAPADVRGTSQSLLVRAGMIRQVAPGYHAYLPLGWRVVQRIAGIVREELEALEGQELWTPDTPPGVFALLPYREIQSYRQLPRLLYQVGARIYHRPQPGEDSSQTHPALTVEAWSLHADEGDLDSHYERMRDAYVRLFRRCGLDVRIMDGSAGPPGATSHAFSLLHPEGDDAVVLCDGCAYAATLTAAVIGKGRDRSDEPELPLEEVATPDCKTIEAVANYLGVPTSQTAKAVFYSGDAPAHSPLSKEACGHGPQAGASEGRLIFAVIRGDLEVNEARLAWLLGTTALRPATEEEIRAVGAEPGYASPVGLPATVQVIVDDSIVGARNLVAGANRPGYHLRNVNYGRDFTAHLVADIAQARQGDPCRRCSAPLHVTTAISLGQTIKMGSQPAAEVGATYLDREGKARVLVIGYYVIDLGKLMLAIVAAHHDEHGIIWPPAVAPFDLHLVRLGRDQAVVEAAEALYASLGERGFAVLYDDREESPGVKFADADLIGAPWRATVSGRSLEAGGVELKARWETAKRVVRPEEIPDLAHAGDYPGQD